MVMIIPISPPEKKYTQPNNPAMDNKIAMDNFFKFLMLQLHPISSLQGVHKKRPATLSLLSLSTCKPDTLRKSTTGTPCKSSSVPVIVFYSSQALCWCML